MKFYLAPLEGVTDYIYRNIYHKMFEPMDAYFIPFLTPNENGKFSERQKKDMHPDNNRGLNVIPQILTNSKEEFISGANYLESIGYREINLNFGCPSKCVMSKGRGAGILKDTELLNRFLNWVFDHTKLRISVKTRIGAEQPEEFSKILEVYNQYPISELIIHPRTGEEHYKGKPHWEQYCYALQNSHIPLCYNGDIFTKEEFENWQKVFPQCKKVMLGRGILGDPLLLSEIKNSESKSFTWMDMQYQLFCAYRKEIGQEKHVLSKLKEFWTYRAMCHKEEIELIRKVYRTNSLTEYAQLLQFERRMRIG